MENTLLNNLTPTFLNIEIKSFIKTKIKRRERPLIVESSRKFRNTSALLKRLWRESEGGGAFRRLPYLCLICVLKNPLIFLTNINFETCMYLYLHIYIYIYMYLVFFQYLEKIGCYLNRKLKRLKSTQFSKTTCLRVNMYTSICNPLILKSDLKCSLAN